MSRIKENKNFENLGVSEQIKLVIDELGFIKATEVQKRAIPLVNNDENLIVNAPTGSGKTLIFVSRIIDVITEIKKIQGIVLVPTKELVIQLEKEFKIFSKYKEISIFKIISGYNLNKKIDEINKSQLLIATPGKLASLIKLEDFDNKINLEYVHILVLDEMDAMLKNEFLEDIETIISNIPRKRQTLMFSATISKEEGKFAQKYMKRARRVLINKDSNKKKLEQQFYLIEPNLKLSLLSHLLSNENSGLNIVFVNRKEVGEFIIKNLKFLKLNIAFIHKDISQSKRDRILNEFRDEKYDVLIATDVIARGLDIKGITHIYNYSIPKEQEKYIHRIGRTARAGANGKVIDFVSKKDEENYLKLLNEKKIKAYFKEVPKNLTEIEIKHQIKKRDFKKSNRKYK